MTAGLIVLLVIAFFVLLVIGRTVRIIPQARAAIVERLGRYSRTLEPGRVEAATEKQGRAEGDRRAASLQADGVNHSQTLTAEGEKRSWILRAEGQRESQRVYAEGQAKAIETVFNAMHQGDPDPKLLAYQY